MNWVRSFSWLELAYIIVFLLLYAYYFWRTGRIGKQIGKASRLRLVKFMMRAAYLGLFIIALLGPIFGKTDTEKQTGIQDILLAIDLSASMNTTDLSPSRLEKAKLELYNLISQLKSNRIGIMLFSTEAHWQVPYTHDFELVRALLAALTTSMVPYPGSNLNAPLAAINQKLTESNAHYANDVFILVTDGEDFGSIDPQVLTDLTKKKAKFIILGVGTPEGGKVPLAEETSTGISRLDAIHLKHLAGQLNADFFIMQNNFSEISDVLHAIKKHPKYAEQSAGLALDNKYNSFLLAGFILAAIDFLLRFKIFRL